MTTRQVDRQVNTVVIGAGQAGLCVSYYLTQHAIEHVVLEQSRIGESWRRRWDSFTLVTPNRLNRLPNFPSWGEPDEFLTREEVIRYLEEFAATFGPPLRLGVRVTAVVPQATGAGYLVETSEGTYRCQHVVVATNIFQTPRPPALAQQVAGDIVQLHSDEYRNPAQLPAGAVLVVGSGQSGAQLADELHHAGKQVFLSVSNAGRLPRRFRGRDMMDWIRIFKLFEQTVDQLDSPADRIAARPHVTGQEGGKTLNLRRFGREGVVLVGRVERIEADRVFFAGDLIDNLRKADAFAADLCSAIGAAIDKVGFDAPPPSDEELVPDDWEPAELVRELSLGEAGITAVIWATGYPFSFAWIEGLEVDASGYPLHERGVTRLPGLYFASLPWLHKHKSSSLYGAGEDAEYVALQIVARAQILSAPR